MQGAGGAIVVVQNGSCAVREFDLPTGLEFPNVVARSTCELWAAPVTAKVAVGIGEPVGDAVPFRFFDLGQPNRDLGSSEAAFGFLVWSDDGQRAAWCNRRLEGIDLEVGRSRRRLPDCPAAYTPDGEVAYALEDRLVTEERELLRASGGITHVHFGSDGSAGIVVEGRRIERYVDGRLADALDLPDRFQGQLPALSPDNCSAVFRAGNRIRILDVGCSDYGGEVASRARGRVVTRRRLARRRRARPGHVRQPPDRRHGRVADRRRPARLAPRLSRGRRNPSTDASPPAMSGVRPRPWPERTVAGSTMRAERCPPATPLPVDQRSMAYQTTSWPCQRVSPRSVRPRRSMTARERRLAGVVIEMSCGSSRCSRQHSTPGATGLGREPAPPPVAVEHPADLDRALGLGPVVVAQEADAADEPPALRVLDGPEAEARLLPFTREARHVHFGVAGRVVLEELRLGVDLPQRLGVPGAPLPQEEPLGAQLPRDHAFASFQSSPTPTSTASGGSSG